MFGWEEESTEPLVLAAILVEPDLPTLALYLRQCTSSPAVRVSAEKRKYVMMLESFL